MNKNNKSKLKEVIKSAAILKEVSKGSDNGITRFNTELAKYIENKVTGETADIEDIQTLQDIINEYKKSQVSVLKLAANEEQIVREHITNNNNNNNPDTLPHEMDDEIYETVTRMLSSKDNNDILMARDIVLNCKMDEKYIEPLVTGYRLELLYGHSMGFFSLNYYPTDLGGCQENDEVKLKGIKLYEEYMKKLDVNSIAQCVATKTAYDTQYLKYRRERDGKLGEFY
jgi:hypothetical protein